jgi:hypothetical protein
VISRRYLEEASRAIAHVAADPQLHLSAGGLDAPPGSHARGPHLSVYAVATALHFLDCGPVLRGDLGNRRKWCSSYWLKHRAEDWGGRLGFERYIANGDLIAAAIWRGVPIRRLRSGPNCEIALKLLREPTTQRASRRPQLRLVRVST